MTVVLSRDESSSILLILILEDLVTSQWVSNGLELSHLIKRRSSFWYYVIYIFFRRMTKKKYDFTCEELHKRATTASSRRSKVLSCTAWLWRDIWGIFSTHYWYMKSIMAKDISKKCLSQNNWRVPKQLISRYKYSRHQLSFDAATPRLWSLETTLRVVKRQIVQILI